MCVRACSRETREVVTRKTTLGCSFGYALDLFSLFLERGKKSGSDPLLQWVRPTFAPSRLAGD